MKYIYLIFTLSLILLSCQKDPEPKIEFNSSELEWINTFSKNRKFNYSYLQSSIVLEVDTILNKPFKDRGYNFSGGSPLQRIILFKNYPEMDIYFYKSDENIFESSYPIFKNPITPNSLQNKFNRTDSLFVLGDSIIENEYFPKVIKFISYENLVPSKIIINKVDGIIQFTRNDTLWTLKK